MRVALFVSLAAAAAIFTTGCAHEQPPPPPSVWPEAPVAHEVQVPKEAKLERLTGSVAVSDEIRRICKVRAPDSKETQFGFDSADLSSAERKVLAQIAKCFTQGPLKGRIMKLTGRADPRGEVEYNMTLGAERAGTVKGFLGSMGVESAKMDDTSRGELDAMGEDEAGWAHDRRVDIELSK